EVIVLLTQVRLDRRGVLERGGGPLVGVAAEEAVEVVEAQSCRPVGERAGGAGVPVGDVVVLAEPGRRVAEEGQDLGDGAAVARHERVVAGETGRLLGDDAGAAAMMVAAGDEGGPGRRA